MGYSRYISCALTSLLHMQKIWNSTVYFTIFPRKFRLRRQKKILDLGACVDFFWKSTWKQGFLSKNKTKPENPDSFMRRGFFFFRNNPSGVGLHGSNISLNYLWMRWGSSLTLTMNSDWMILGSDDRMIELIDKRQTSVIVKVKIITLKGFVSNCKVRNCYFSN